MVNSLHETFIVSNVENSELVFQATESSSEQANLPPLPEAPNPFLSNRQLEILRWLLRGIDQVTIAQWLPISRNTIKGHIRMAKEKFETLPISHYDSFSFALFCLQQGYIHPDELEHLQTFYGEKAIRLLTDKIEAHPVWLTLISEVAKGAVQKTIAHSSHRSYGTVRGDFQTVSKHLELPGVDVDALVMIAILAEVIDLDELTFE